MRLIGRTAHSCVLTAILACARPALAGAPAPCLKAVSSKNGDFIVISDVQLEPEHGDNARVRRVSLQVFPRENFINAKDRVISLATFWTDFVKWSVILDSSKSHPIPGCPLPLITDDGEFLIVLNEYALDFGGSALRIYRRRDHLGDSVREGLDNGVLIRDIALKELWPPGKMPKIVSDETPQWFGGGTFEFSPDSRRLIHKTRWGNIVSINLSDGSVSTD